MLVLFARLRLPPRWVAGLGLVSSAIYLLAQAELLATVLPGFPVWSLVGFIGSTLWLIIVGVLWWRRKD